MSESYLFLLLTGLEFVWCVTLASLIVNFSQIFAEIVELALK